jgi:hypothetical protein
MTIPATVVKTKTVEIPASANRPLRDLHDTSNKANPTPVDAKVVRKLTQVPLGGTPETVSTGQVVEVKPMALTPPKMVGNVPHNEVGLHSLMVKDFHSFVTKVQMLSHTNKESIMNLVKELEKRL